MQTSFASMVSSLHGFTSKHFSFNCTTKPDDFTASYKFKSLSREYFKPSDEMEQTDKRQINKQVVSQTGRTIWEWYLNN